MTTHILTEETTLESQVRVMAPVGERPEKVVQLAIEKVQSVRGRMKMMDPPTSLHISRPKHVVGREWWVRITYRIRTLDVVELPPDPVQHRSEAEAELVAVAKLMAKVRGMLDTGLHLYEISAEIASATGGKIEYIHEILSRHYTEIVKAYEV